LNRLGERAGVNLGGISARIFDRDMHSPAPIVGDDRGRSLSSLSIALRPACIEPGHVAYHTVEQEHMIDAMKSRKHEGLGNSSDERKKV